MKFLKRWLKRLTLGCLTLAVGLWALSASGCLVMPGPHLSEAQRAALSLLQIPWGAGYTLAGFERPGPGPREIWVHGTPGSAEDLLDFIVDPALGGDAIAIDRPGFGKSLPNRAFPSLEDQVAAIEPLLVEIDGQKPILIGHSLGGPIIAAAAARYPDRIGGLVILAGSLDPAQEELQWFNHLLKHLGSLAPGFAAHSNQEILALKPELEALGQVLDRIVCPVLIIHGKRDELVPYSNVDYIQSKLVNAERVELLTLERTGHLFVFDPEYQAETRKAIRSFFSEAQQGPANPTVTR